MTKVPLKILILFLLPILTWGQNAKEESDLIKAMCLEFQKTENLSDTLRVENAYSKYLYPYLLKFDEAKADSIGTSIYFRFQRECETFWKFLNKIHPVENWGELQDMPESELTKSDRAQFKKTKRFYYLEGDNERVEVAIENGLWQEAFPDQTYSKNKFKWKNDPNDFELEFIESNNIPRKGFSRKGDKYNYRIVRKVDDYYEIAAQIPKQDQVLLFKLYIE